MLLSEKMAISKKKKDEKELKLQMLFVDAIPHKRVRTKETASCNTISTVNSSAAPKAKDERKKKLFEVRSQKEIPTTLTTESVLKLVESTVQSQIKICLKLLRKAFWSSSC